MTVLVVTLAVMVALLAVLVAGLLRSHATILKRLHELDTKTTTAPPPFRTLPGVPPPPGGEEGQAFSATSLDDPTVLVRSPDIVGRGLRDDAMVVRTSGSEADTILLFLSSGCSTCQAFWTELADPVNVRLPPGARLLIVTKGPESESISALVDLDPGTVEVVMSSQAWVDFSIPGSPYVVAVDGVTGRVKGEGTGMSWDQVARLLAQATGDMAYIPVAAGANGKRPKKAINKPTGDAEREARVDRELLAAGILPGDNSLYQPLSDSGSHGDPGSFIDAEPQESYR